MSILSTLGALCWVTNSSALAWWRQVRARPIGELIIADVTMRGSLDCTGRLVGATSSNKFLGERLRGSRDCGDNLH